MKCIKCGNNIENNICPYCNYDNNQEVNPMDLIPDMGDISKKARNKRKNDMKYNILSLFIVIILLVFGIGFLAPYLKNTFNENDNKEVVIKEEPIFSEKEVYEFLMGRGFSSEEINYEWTMDGKYKVGEVNKDSDEKHPTYTSYFQDEFNNYFSITIVGKHIYANLLSNKEKNNGIDTLISESEKIVTYNGTTKKFTESVPNKKEIKIIIVDKLDVSNLKRLKID